jgi:hypothetical protein
VPPLPNGSIALAIPPVWDESVDEAYLLLSLAGVNFTSVLEIDPTLYNYKVIMIPYDPLEDTRTVTVNLLKTPIAYMSGAVTINADTVDLGDHSERLGNIVVWRNPFYLLPETFNVTIRFRINEYNPKVLNYFSFVYDFQDLRNYKYIAVMFSEQNQVKAFNCVLIEGNITCSPAWPDVSMEGSVNILGEHIIKVSLNSTSKRLCLTFDSMRPVCFFAKYSGGLIGVKTDRLWSVEVKDMTLEASEVSFLEKKRLETGNYTVLALKKGSNETLETMLGNTRIYYIEFSRDYSAYRYLPNFIREILVTQEEKYADFIPEKYHSEIAYSNLAASKVILYNLTMVSPSIILVPSDSLLQYLSYNQLGAKDINYVVLTGSPNTSLKLFSDFATLKSGIGFYAVVEISNPHIQGEKIFLHFCNGSSMQLEGNLRLMGSFLVLVRRPVFTANQATIKGVVAQSLLYPYVSRDIQVRGSATFNFLVGDSSLMYFVVDAARAKFSFEQPLDFYSEWESVPLLLKHLPLSLALTVLVLGMERLPKSLQKFRKLLT